MREFAATRSSEATMRLDLPKNLHRSCLPDSVRSCHSLKIVLRIEIYNVERGLEVE